VWTREGGLYLAVVIDMFSRSVVGWAVGDCLHRQLAIAALQIALTMWRRPAGLSHHSDLGSQYCSIDYQAVLRSHGIWISMSGKGNCYDNAMVETVFKTLKSRLVSRTTFFTRAEAERDIARYIDGFYNPVRRHSALDYLSHAQFEKQAVRLVERARPVKLLFHCDRFGQISWLIDVGTLGERNVIGEQLDWDGCDQRADEWIDVRHQDRCGRAVSMFGEAGCVRE
jgi:hypothetical protein